MIHDVGLGIMVSLFNFLRSNQMLLYFFISLVYLLAVYLLGYTVFRLGQMRKEGATSAPHFELFIIGFLSFSILAAYCSLFFSLNVSFLLTMVCGCLIFLAWDRKRFTTSLQVLSRLKGRDWVILLLMLVALCAISAKGITNYDSGLYHLQSIKWNQEYALVPGLANLHGRFGFNSLFFTLSAPLSINQTLLSKELLLFPLNTILLWVFVVWMYFKVKQSVVNFNLQWLAFDLSLIGFALFFFTDWLGSPTPDIACSILCLILFRRLLEPIQELKMLYLISATAAVCVSFKLSTILLLFLPLLLVKKESIFKDLLRISAIYSLVFLPFFIRNYYLSGYLVYPFYSLDIFDPIWKVPLTKAIEEQIWIKSWARIADSPARVVLAMPLAEWVPIWFKRLDPVNTLLVCCTALLPIAQLFSFKQFSRQTNFLLVMLFLNLLFWFFQAPDPRFARGFLILAAVMLCFIFSGKWLSGRLRRAVQLVFLALFLYLGADKFLNRTVSRTQELIAESNLIFPKGYDLEQGQMKVNPYEGHFIYYVPASGDRCFNAPLPCTPYPKENLVLRGEDLQSGFILKTKAD